MHNIVLLLLSSALFSAGVQSDLSERIGNFSIEVLYHTSKYLQENQNFILSPFSIWNAMATIIEGASGRTAQEIQHAIRIRKKSSIHNDLKNISQSLKIDTSTTHLTKVNIIVVDKYHLLLSDYQATAKEQYETDVIPVDYNDSVNLTNALNNAISNATHGVIKKIVVPEYFQNTGLVVSSAVYFKGLWSVPFDASSTAKLPFYNSAGQKIGYVNMMYKRYAYSFRNFRELQARVVELPYGKDNRTSMFIMLPNPSVSVEHMFKNFVNIGFNAFFEEMRISKLAYRDDEVDCFIPRFKIESDLGLLPLLKNNFGIETLFNRTRATLPFIARTPLHVSNIFHKAHIEVTEQGSTTDGIKDLEYNNNRYMDGTDFKERIEVISVNANRPFAYIIVEKDTNTIILGGCYKEPVLY